jgi:flagellar motor switch protein FliN
MPEYTTDELAVIAAEAAADVLPAVEPLTPGPAQPGSPHVTSAFAGAALADLDGPVPGRIGVLVGSDLVEALAASPLGGLDLAAAVQPALDAVAMTLGARAQAARTVELDLVVSDLGGEFVTVPLIGAGIDGAVLLPLATLRAGRPGTVPAAAAPAAAMPPAGAPVPPPGSGAAIGTQFVPPAPREGGQPVSYAAQRGIEMLHGVDMEVTVELGRTRMTVRDLLALAPGAVLELDRAAGSPADLLVNGRLIARGEVVVVDEDFGLRVTEILDDSALA